MKNELIPGLSAVMTEKEYLLNSEAMNKLPTIFILAENFTLYRRTRTAGGYSLSVFNKLPPGADKLPSLMAPGFSHLPGGKIPVELLSQIGSWFQDIAKETSDEAMAHILWNKTTKAYEIGIPTQAVAGAAVDYKFDDVCDHHVIVLDIHSHNNMGSFWSGRDDTDDGKGIWISGVLGTLGTKPSISLRYSDRGIFIKTTFEDVFSKPFSEVDFDAEYPKDAWSAKVSLRKITVPSYKAQQVNYDYTYDHNRWSRSGGGVNRGLGYHIGEHGELILDPIDPMDRDWESGDGDDVGFPRVTWDRETERHRTNHVRASGNLLRGPVSASLVKTGIADLDKAINLLSSVANLKDDEAFQVKLASASRIGGFTHPIRGLLKVLPDYLLPLLLNMFAEEIARKDRAGILHAGAAFKGGTLDRMQDSLLQLEEVMSAIRYPTE